MQATILPFCSVLNEESRISSTPPYWLDEKEKFDSGKNFVQKGVCATCKASVSKTADQVSENLSSGVGEDSMLSVEFCVTAENRHQGDKRMLIVLFPSTTPSNQLASTKNREKSDANATEQEGAPSPCQPFYASQPSGIEGPSLDSATEYQRKGDSAVKTVQKSNATSLEPSIFDVTAVSSYNADCPLDPDTAQCILKCKFCHSKIYFLI